MPNMVAHLAKKRLGLLTKKGISGDEKYGRLTSNQVNSGGV